MAPVTPEPVHFTHTEQPAAQLSARLRQPVGDDLTCSRRVRGADVDRAVGDDGVRPRGGPKRRALHEVSEPHPLTSNAVTSPPPLPETTEPPMASGLASTGESQTGSRHSSAPSSRSRSPQTRSRCPRRVPAVTVPIPSTGACRRSACRDSARAIGVVGLQASLHIHSHCDERDFRCGIAPQRRAHFGRSAAVRGSVGIEGHHSYPSHHIGDASGDGHGPAGAAGCPDRCHTRPRCSS